MVLQIPFFATVNLHIELDYWVSRSKSATADRVEHNHGTTSASRLGTALDTCNIIKATYNYVNGFWSRGRAENLTPVNLTWKFCGIHAVLPVKDLIMLVVEYTLICCWWTSLDCDLPDLLKEILTIPKIKWMKNIIFILRRRRWGPLSVF